LLSQQVGVLRALRDGTPMPPEEPKAVTIDLPLTVGLPENYIGDTQLRVQLYRRAASLDSEDKIREFEEELEDRFGKLPGPARNLTYQLRLKLIATEFGAQSITTDGNRFTVRAEAIGRMNPQRLQRLLGSDALIGRTQVSFLRSGTPEQWKQRLMDTMTRLAEMKAALSPPAERKPQVILEAEPEARAGRDPDLPPMAHDDDW
jgi:transcription-repair coupling factor (superfamily II helicase)